MNHNWQIGFIFIYLYMLLFKHPVMIHLDSTFGPDVEVSTGVSCDGVSILGKRHTQHILWLLMFL